MAENQQLHLQENLESEENREFLNFQYNGLTNEEISKIPVVIDVPVGESCCICLGAVEEGDVIRQLVCHHNFHQVCILKWLEANITCPLCRFRLTPRITIKEMIDEFDLSDFSESDASFDYAQLSSQSLFRDFQNLEERFPTIEAPARQFSERGFGFYMPPVQIREMSETVGSMSMRSSSSLNRDSLSVVEQISISDEEIDEEASGSTETISETSQPIEDQTKNETNEQFDWYEEVVRAYGEIEQIEEDEEMSIDQPTKDMDVSMTVDMSFDENESQVVFSDQEKMQSIEPNEVDINLIDTSEQPSTLISMQRSFRSRSPIQFITPSSSTAARLSLIRPRRLLRGRHYY